MNSTGKSASDWAQEMSALRAIKPRPTHKLWNNPANAPADQVAAHRKSLRAWESRYRYASKMQKFALEEDNAAFHAAAARQK